MFAGTLAKNDGRALSKMVIWMWVDRVGRSPSHKGSWIEKYAEGGGKKFANRPLLYLYCKEGGKMVSTTLCLTSAGSLLLRPSLASVREIEGMRSKYDKKFIC